MPRLSSLFCGSNCDPTWKKNLLNLIRANQILIQQSLEERFMAYPVLDWVEKGSNGEKGFGSFNTKGTKARRWCDAKEVLDATNDNDKGALAMCASRKKERNVSVCCQLRVRKSKDFRVLRLWRNTHASFYFLLLDFPTGLTGSSIQVEQDKLIASVTMCLTSRYWLDIEHYRIYLNQIWPTEKLFHWICTHRQHANIYFIWHNFFPY